MKKNIVNMATLRPIMNISIGSTLHTVCRYVVADDDADASTVGVDVDIGHFVHRDQSSTSMMMRMRRMANGGGPAARSAH